MFEKEKPAHAGGRIGAAPSRERRRWCWRVQTERAPSSRWPCDRGGILASARPAARALSCKGDAHLVGGMVLLRSPAPSARFETRRSMGQRLERNIACHSRLRGVPLRLHSPRPDGLRVATHPALLWRFASSRTAGRWRRQAHRSCAFTRVGARSVGRGATRLAGASAVSPRACGREVGRRLRVAPGGARSPASQRGSASG
jgi:hypothetical protein